MWLAVIRYCVFMFKCYLNPKPSRCGVLWFGGLRSSAAGQGHRALGVAGGKPKGFRVLSYCRSNSQEGFFFPQVLWRSGGDSRKPPYE